MLRLTIGLAAGLWALLAGASGCAGVMVGAHLGYEGDPHWQSNILALETAIGRKLAIDSDYEDWGGFPNVARAQWDIQNGRVPMLSWRIYYRLGTDSACATASNIVAGRYDQQLARQAAQIKSLVAPVLIRFNYEMTNNAENTCFTGFPIDRNLALAGQKYIVAWRHIVDVFRRNGVTNARWVWAPGGNAYEKHDWRLFFPGVDFVDWIGLDKYNKSDTQASFADDPSIKAFYEQTSTLGKPLMIAETGAVNDPAKHPDPQSVWLATARLFLKDHPAIAAFVYFNAPGEYDNLHPGYGGSGYVLQGPGLAWFKFLADYP